MIIDNYKFNGCNCNVVTNDDGVIPWACPKHGGGANKIGDTKKMIIKAVFIFPNGLCAVIGEDEAQIPELQGQWETQADYILKLCDNNTLFYDGRTKNG